MIQPPILAVAGPTASGKTRLAVALAKYRRAHKQQEETT